MNRQSKWTWCVLFAVACLAPTGVGAQDTASDEASPPGDEAPGDEAPGDEAIAEPAEPPEAGMAAIVEPEPELPPSEQPEAPAEEHDDFRESWITLGLRAGVYIPSIVNRMDPHADLSFEVGLLLPFLDRMLSIIADVSWAPPGRAQELTDPRVGEAGGAWSYSMETQHVMISGGVLFRFLVPGSVFVPYLSAVARAYLLQTRVTGEGNGAAFGENVEQSTQGGFAVSLGGELRLGPGALLLDVSFGYSDLPHRITGITSTGSLATQLGYRLFL